MVESLERPADHVTLTPGFVFLADPDGGSLNIPVADVRSLRVVVTERPPDYARLRERYPHAYDAWHRHVLGRLQVPGPIGHRAAVGRRDRPAPAPLGRQSA